MEEYPENPPIPIILIQQGNRVFKTVLNLWNSLALFA